MKKLVICGNLVGSPFLVQLLQKTTFCYKLRKRLGLESEAELYGTPLPKVTYKGQTLEACSIVFSRKAKRMNLTRWLAGKFVYFPESVTRIEILAMYDNMIHIQNLAEKDENFQKKFGKSLEVLTKILKGFRVSSKTGTVEVKNIGSQIEKELHGFYYQKRNIKPQETIMKSYFSVHPMKSQGIPLKEIKPKGYIGKGYTDKGTARNPAKDGSPSWQEVAMSKSGEENESEQKIPVSNTTK